MNNGIPFTLELPKENASAYDEMSKAEFDTMMAAGLKQAKKDDSFDVDEVFELLNNK